MAIQRKYTFQYGSKISSTQMNEELNQLVDEVNKKSVLAQESWLGLSLLNGWINYGGGYATPAFRKNNNGEVELRGMIKSGLTTRGTVIAYLPAGYRPIYNKTYSVVSSDGTDTVIGRITLIPDGGIQIFSGTNVLLSLESIPPIPTN